MEVDAYVVEKRQASPDLAVELCSSPPEAKRAALEAAQLVQPGVSACLHSPMLVSVD